MLWKNHLISVDQFNVEEIQSLFFSNSMIDGFTFPRKKIAILFYEPSTRTSASFQSAAHDLDCKIISINGVEYSSVAKGETLHDTVLTLAQYVDLIILRHPDSEAAAYAASISPVPIINAGCGNGEHPTQGLLDLFTIQKHFQNWNKFTDMRITFFGDLLNSRTVHSSVKLIALYDNASNYINYVAPLSLQIPLSLKGLVPDVYIYPEQIENVLPYTDVLYVTRVQKERGSVAEYSLTHEQLNMLPENSIVMHPFPRPDGEIPISFDSDPRAKYFEQIKNGVYIRTAILYEMLKVNVLSKEM